MAEQNTTNQDAYKNRQRYKINTKEIYNSFIKPGIDDYRSMTNINGQTEKNIIDAIRNNSLRQLLKPKKTYQESRCHAFYRMIGFPVYNGDKFYNPGLDHVETSPDGSKKNIDNSMKKEIAIGALTLIKNFTKICDARESIPVDFLKVFALNTTIEASTLALSSTKIRKFISSFENIAGEPLPTDPLKQSYGVWLSGQVGDYKPNLSSYINAQGETPKTYYIQKRSHIIAPFLVDPRYSESANLNKMPSVPFVLAEHQLKASETVTVEIPLLESIIVNRLSYNNLIGTESELDKIKKYIQNDPSINDNTLVKSILSNNQLTEQQQFLEYIDIMKAMLFDLIKAQKAIDNVQKRYYWLPIPATTGPEYGVSVRPIILSEKLANNRIFITYEDSQLIKATLNKLSNQTAASKGYASIKRKAVFPLSARIFNPQVNDSTGDNVYDDVKDLTKKRELAMKQAGDALQIIEMIMGEFSGLGLCDILAIIASLYIMPIDKLIGFLDTDAFERMKVALNVPNAVREPSLMVCLSELTSKVTDFYNLMDKIYEDFLKNQGLL